MVLTVVRMELSSITLAKGGESRWIRSRSCTVPVLYDLHFLVGLYEVINGSICPRKKIQTIQWNYVSFTVFAIRSCHDNVYS
jgi:hypothetical protein